MGRVKFLDAMDRGLVDAVGLLHIDVCNVVSCPPCEELLFQGYSDLTAND